jgi:hypothetical protein
MGGLLLGKGNPGSPWTPPFQRCKPLLKRLHIMCKSELLCFDTILNIHYIYLIFNMCRPPILKIIDKEHLIDKNNLIKKPKRVSFDLVQKNEEPKAPTVSNNLIISSMFALSQLQTNLQTALTRILVLEKELVETKERENVLILLCENHNKLYLTKHNGNVDKYYFDNISINHTTV